MIMLCVFDELLFQTSRRETLRRNARPGQAATGRGLSGAGADWFVAERANGATKGLFALGSGQK